MESDISKSSDDEFEEISSMPATITPLIIEEEDKPIGHIKIAPKLPVLAPAPSITYPRIQIAQNLHNTSQNTVTLTPRFQTNTSKPIQTVQANIQTTIPSNMSIPPKIQTATVPANTVTKTNNSTLPFPLLILNGTGNGVQVGQNGTAGLLQKTIPVNNGANAVAFNSEISSILKEMLEIQKENLEIEKERLQVEKQKLEYERAVGSQLLNMVPMFNEIFQKFKRPEEEEDTKNFKEHPSYNKNLQNGVKRLAASDSPDKASKIFKQAASVTRKNGQESSDTDGDSGIANDSM